MLFTDWRWAWRGRRVAARRTGGDDDTGTDRYPISLVAVGLALFLFSAADAFFTLQLLAAGVAREVNPLMRWLIEHDTQVFVNIKLTITAAGVVFMVVCADTRVLRLVRVRRVMQALCAMYALLIAYEISGLIALFS